MKKWLKILLLMLSLPVCLLTWVDCTDVQEEPLDEANMIRYAPGIKSQKTTKSVISGVVYPTSESFCTTAYFYEKNNDPYSSAKLYIAPKEISYTNGVWKGSTPDFWPLSGYLEFMAYSPSSVEATFSAENGVTFDGYEIAHRDGNGDIISDDALKTDLNLTDARIDFCCSEPVKQENATHGQNVQTQFKHCLTQICFKAIPIDYYTKSDTQDGIMTTNTVSIRVDEIYLDNCYYKGNFIQRTEGQTPMRWIIGNPNTDEDDDEGLYNYVLYKKPQGEGVLLRYDDNNNPDTVAIQEPGTEDEELSVLMIPQSFYSSSKLRVVYSVRQCTTINNLNVNPATEVTESDFTTSTTKTVPMSDICSSWSAGKKYVYFLNIGLDVILFEASPVDWELETGGGEVN